MIIYPFYPDVNRIILFLLYSPGLRETEKQEAELDFVLKWSPVSFKIR